MFTVNVKKMDFKDSIETIKWSPIWVLIDCSQQNVKTDFKVSVETIKWSPIWVLSEKCKHVKKNDF